MNKPKEIYEHRIKRYHSLLKRQKKLIYKLSNIRLLVFLSGALISFYFFFIKYTYLAASIFTAFLILFIWVAVIHNKFINKTKYTEALIEVNEISLKRLDGSWKEFKDIGETFLDINHGFSSDLDLFGKNSLFQLINSSSTFHGRQRLKQILTTPETSISKIEELQLAVKELTEKIAFRQRLTSVALVTKPEIKAFDNLYSWSKATDSLYEKKLLIFSVNLSTFVTIILTLLPFITPAVPYYVPFIMYLINFSTIIPKSQEKANILKEIYGYKESLMTSCEMLEIIEKTKFSSAHLSTYKKDIEKASKQIENLAKICEKVAIRSSSIYLIINILLLWDYRCLIALEAWKKENGKNIERWITACSEFEALCSISNIAFNNPEWCYPNISPKADILNAVEIGHPLIVNSRVCNSFSMAQDLKTLLITGSNMSGKSTFLRTLGVNFVLAYCGSPVCAKEFDTSIYKLYTCMRIADNLEENISSFYAELIRIKMIVTASKENNNIFYLLDEIFKGTNSIDRHIGAKTLIKQLKNYGARGLISTHDLELGDMEQQSSNLLKNYHFEEYYKDNKIYFDYKIKRGISTTRNALYLIKLAGLDVDEYNS